MAKKNFGLSCLLLCILSLWVGAVLSVDLRDHPIAGDSVTYLDGQWQLSDGNTNLRGSVPGDLITDLYMAGKVGDPIHNNNWLNSFLWNNNTWTYTISFTTPQVTATTKETMLVFDGVKMGAVATLNGNPLGTFKDQFLRYVFPVQKLLRPSSFNTLSVTFPKGPGPDVEGRFMACTGGWDWAPYSNTFDQHHAQTLSKGIWKSVYLTTVSSVAINQVVPSIHYTGPYPRTPLTDSNHSPFLVRMSIHLTVPAGGASGVIQIRTDWGTVHSENITLPQGDYIYNATLSTQGKSIKLWWPNGLGAQHLYNISVSFAPSASGSPTVTSSRRVGFRVVALVTTKDDEDPIDDSLKDGSGAFTMRFRINGANVFTRGANMIPMEEFEGRANAEAFRYLVQSARDAHMNILRIWGGGIFYYDVFYDSCDEMGLILYHDMMYAQEGHSPLATATQSQEIRYQVRRLSHHPSIVMWDGCNECGGQGIYSNFVVTTVAEEDNSRAVWPSCPSRGWVSGVDTQYGTPNGNPLVPRTTGGVKEYHGPYQHGSGWPAVNGDKKLELFPANIPPYLGGPTGMGIDSEGYYVSEFGCVGWSSFESMTATLDSQYWSLHSPPMYQRNYPCDNIIDVYWGKQNLNVTGAAAFKKQLYQCLIGQTLELKSEIEYLRSTNTFGTVIWQLNEIWPTGGWGSIEYGTPVAGQTLGGRWKPLHYTLKRTLFPDVTATCGNQSFCIVRNDAPSSFTGTVDIQMIHYSTGKVSSILSNQILLGGSSTAQWFCLQKKNVDLSAAGNTSSSSSLKNRTALDCAPWATIFQSYGCTRGGADCLVLLTVTAQGGSVVSENVLLLDVPQNLNLPRADVTFSVSPGKDGGADVTLASSSVALYVTMTTQSAGRFSDNAMLLLPGKTTVHFYPYGSFNINTFTSSLRIEHMQQYLNE